MHKIQTGGKIMSDWEILEKVLQTQEPRTPNNRVLYNPLKDFKALTEIKDIVCNLELPREKWSATCREFELRQKNRWV